MDGIKYNPIKEKNIRMLEQNGCRANDWSRVLIIEGFNPSAVHQVHFSGDVKLGMLGGTLTLADGSERISCIRNSMLHNVTIKDNCYIANVHNGLFNIDIESNVVIENVGKILCSGETTFGNGHQVSVLSEAGGREFSITAKTGAQTAYLNVLYRHDPNLIDKLEKIADRYTNSLKRNRCYIGNNACIQNCSELVDVYIGDYATLNGVSKLKNGTIDSSEEAPALVGNDVIADNFIFQKGSCVEDGSMISSGLIGEGTKIGKQFSAENSVLFANSEGFHSEITSVFGGPYTVTHHRSTLLIAGLFSFYNAGSGTNQSNHMYKLGPVHQGILERGCKTGSFSYLLWPCRVGAFTAIIGKHYANFNTADLPFSYISEDNGKSMLIPGMNLFTTGTLRDGLKWPTRDRRRSKEKLDFIIFDVLSPYTMQKVIRGFNELTTLYENADKSQEFISYNGIRIKRLLLKTSRRYYRMAIDKYFGDMIINRFNKEKPANLRDILKYDEQGDSGEQEWLDMLGLLCAKNRVDHLIEKIKNNTIDSFESVHAELKNIYNSYEADAWNWFLTHYKKLNGVELSDETDENLTKFITTWKQTSIKFYHLIQQDSQKEFEGSVNLSYGIDGHRGADFENVRGRFEDNKFVTFLKDEIDIIHQKYDEISQALN